VTEKNLNFLGHVCRINNTRLKQVFEVMEGHKKPIGMARLYNKMVYRQENLKGCWCGCWTACHTV